MKKNRNANSLKRPIVKRPIVPLKLRPVARAVQSSIFLMSLGCAAAQAAEIVVNSPLDDNGAGCTLREAISSANTSVDQGNGCSIGSDLDLDSIVFDNNVFGANTSIALTQGELALSDKTLTLSAQSTLEGVTLMATNPTRVMRVTGGNVALSNMTLSGGKLDSDLQFGGGLSINTGANVVLINSHITNNRADFGGGIHVGSESSLTLENSTVTNNTTYTGFESGFENIPENAIDSSGGGIFLENDSSLVIESSELTNNTASASTNAKGGGIRIGDRNIVGIYNSNIAENTVSSGTVAIGGGINIGNDNTVTISNSSVSNNQSLSAGVINTGKDNTMTISNSSISNNQGGGLTVGLRTTLDLTDSRIEENVSMRGGGVSTTRGGELKLTMVRSSISNNVGGSQPGGLYLSNSTASITDSSISGNSRDSGYGAGFDFSSSTVNLYNSTISNNSSIAQNSLGNVSAAGGYIRDGSTVTFDNVTVADNILNSGRTRAGTVPGLFIISSSVTLANSIVANGQNLGDITDPERPIYFANCYAAFSEITIDASSIVEGGGCGAIRTDDPGLLPLSNNGGPTSPQALADDSIAINTGNSATCLDTDQRGASRDAQCDVGAFEFGGNLSSFSITFASDSIAENSGTSTGTVTRTQPFDQALTVELQSSDLASVTVPSSVQIPANAASANFAITVLDNSIADGNRSATVTGSATNFVDSTAQITVIDNEVAALNISVPVNTVPENNRTSREPLVATLSRNTPTDMALTVAINSSDTSTLTVPSSVTIPAGQASTTFDITVLNDELADGNSLVTINASADGLLSSNSELTVIDDDIAALSINVRDESITENGGATVATVSRNTPVATALEVTLSNADASRLSLPSTINFREGENSITFSINAVDDLIANGNADVNITASSNGLESSLVTVTVIDNDVAVLNLSLEVGAEEEGSGAIVATLRRNTPSEASLIVALSSSDANRLSVPANVIIPANESSITFAVDVLDNTLVDGDVDVTVTASARDLINGFADLTILDDDLPTLTLTTPSTDIAETSGTVTATLSRNTPNSTAPLTVALTSSDTNRITMPNSVTFADGEINTQIDITVIDDAIATGNSQVTLTATTDNSLEAVISLTVIDDDEPSLTLNFEQTTLDEAGSLLGRVSRNTPSDEVLNVTLVSSDPTAATVVETLQIPVGATSAEVVVFGVDNTQVDPQRSITITASDVNGNLSRSIANLSVIDNDDDDNDTIANNVDNCPANSNTNQANLDGDRFGDACDSDIDGDGMPNSYEQANGLNPRNAADANADSDGDGFSNLQEFVFGSDPNVADSDENDNGTPDAVEGRKFNFAPIFLLLLDDD